MNRGVVDCVSEKIVGSVTLYGLLKHRRPFSFKYPGGQ